MIALAQPYFFTILSIILIVNSAESRSFDEFKKNLISIRNFDIFNGFNGNTFKNWTQDEQCLKELNAIQNGLKNSEEWAFKIVDAWGKFPSGIFNYNFFDLGSFSECFHIERHGVNYKTQYCIGQLILEAPEQRYAKKIQKTSNDLPFRQRLGFYYTGPSISLGICLPSACSVEQLESSVNRIIHQKWQNMTVRIVKDYCQTEETPSEFKTIDLIALGLLVAVLVLMTMSTVYDIVCDALNYKRCQQLLVFSIYTNGKQLFSNESTSSPHIIQCLNGIRSITTIWIVVSHAYYVFFFLPSREHREFVEYGEKYRSAVVFPPIIVDTFFVIAGLLQSIKLLKMLKKGDQLNICSMYLQRFLRLTPMLVGAILMTMLLRFAGSGPFWPFAIDHLIGTCGRYWWSTLFYIQNYANQDALCYPHTWYLSADMQLFVLSPFVVYLIHRYKMKAIIGLAAVILGCVAYTFTIHLIYNITHFFSPGKFFLDVHATHSRLSSWLIGIIAGYVFVEFPQESARIPKKLNLCVWPLSLILMAIAIFGFHPFYPFASKKSTSLEYGLYAAYSHIIWSIPLCYIIFACARNSGGPINRFLSHPIWQPFSRLSYAIYIVHHPVILLTAASIKILPHFNEITFIQSVIGYIGLSMLVAILATLAFDSPIDNIYKLIFRAEARTPSSSSSSSMMNGSIEKKIS